MSILDSLKNLSELDINSLDFENIGDWPDSIKAVFCGIGFVITLILGYQFHITDLLAVSGRVEVKEKKLKDKYILKARDAAHLDHYVKQMKEMETYFGALLRQLPGDTEVPGLLDDITYTARGAGLQVEHIRLKPELVNEFYIELPISILVKGTYHDFGNFISGTAALSRIVTLHDLSIKPESGSGTLAMEILAKTYRYRDTGGGR
ncbi:MAG: type 4a pilus biogenesis protein PilO [Endozoicomonas sp. (ex Botrylloides leachii)]|nr:type 4a pilus biogenesis protein PilO [Endozoicomonas sp. (ex Botrylloides leachii)]